MQLSVLQWNVWFKENIERVLKVLQEYNADVICLQELTRGYTEQKHANTWEYVASELGFGYCFQEIPIFAENAQWAQANAIFSRFPIEHTIQSWLHEPAESDRHDDQYRGYHETTIAIPDHSVQIATTHMSFNPRPDNDQELDRLLHIITNKQRRYILTGDLNAIPVSPRIREISRRLTHAGPSYRQATWTTKPFLHEDFEANSLDWRYDYIFVTPDIQVVDSRIIKTDTSDHLPVYASLMIP